MAALLGKLADAGVGADEAGPIYLWPENVSSWAAFIDLRDQWRDGVLPRADLLAHLREVCADAAERREVYAGVCACARAVVDVFAAHRRRQRASAG